MTALGAIEKRLGSTITRIRRIYYELEGSLDRTKGDLELWFGDDVLWLRCAPNGEELRVDEERWTDPFEPPIDAETEAWVKNHGKFVGIDVSDVPPYDALVGHRLDAAEPIANESKHLVGVRVRAGEAMLRICVEGDELFVTPS